MKRHVVW